MLMLHSSDWDTERAALTLLADKCGRWCFGQQREKAVSMPSGREREFHTRGAKTPLFQALEEMFHNSLLLYCSRVLTNIFWLVPYFVGSDTLWSTWQKYIEAKIRAKELHIKVWENFSQSGDIWVLVSPTLLLEMWPHQLKFHFSS